MNQARPSCFQYPPNVRTLDLATLVSMYRSRGEPYKIPKGDEVACCLTKNLLKHSKRWFGLHYSQKAWDSLLTTGSEGYPLTEVEFNVLGLIHSPPQLRIGREFVEQNCGIIPQLGFLIFNDLRQFGFIIEPEEHLYKLSERGEKALDGISRRLFETEFQKKNLWINSH
jgi:hypothetical protein